MGRKSSEDAVRPSSASLTTWQNLIVDSHAQRQSNMHRDKGWTMEDVLCVLWLDGQPGFRVLACTGE